MRKNKKFLDLVLFLSLGFLLIVFLTTCKSEEKSEEKTEKENIPMVINKDVLSPILGVGEGSVSGLMDVEQSSEELQISYYYFIEDMAYFDEEIERDLAPKIQEMYEKFPEIDRVAFTVNVPTEDETPYKPYVSFVVTRDLVEKTDWTNLLELEFFKVVLDVKYYE